MSLPARIKNHAQLRIEHRNGAPHLLVGKPIKAGDLLFEIKEPLIAIVNDGKKALQRTCDYCFSTIHTLSATSALSTTPGPNFKRGACASCKVVHYYNPTCQKSGWAHHHKYECAILERLSNDPMHASKVWTCKTRTIIRLSLLLMAKKITNYIMAEFQPDDEYVITTPAEVLVNNELAKLVKEITGVPVKECALLDFLVTLKYNWKSIQLPVIKDDLICMSREVTATLHIGKFVDPFVLMMHHSCDANAWAVFEGSRLRVRALRDISANEVLTLNQARETPDRGLRRHYLEEDFDINCACTLRSNPPRGPIGGLRQHILKLSELLPPESTDQIHEMETAIEDMLKSGLGYGSLTMRALHEVMMTAHAFKGDYDAAFKICLKIYYLIEPPSLTARLQTLYRICCFMVVPKPKPVPLSEGQTPVRMQDLTPHIVVHLHEQLLGQIKKCFGQDTAVVKWEEPFLTELKEIYASSIMVGGVTWKYVPLEEGVKAKEMFLEQINVLLEWAVVGKLTEEALI